jgi:NAD-dependent dihydropyrimidine dehydrogenase PreA subunit
MFQVQETLCAGCETCVAACPVEAIFMEGGYAHIDQDLCTDCGICVDLCPEGAIFVLADSDHISIKEEPAASRAGPPTEIIQVELPPPPVVVEESASPSLAQRVAPTVGAALGFLGREVLPKLVQLAVDTIEDRLARSRAERSSEMTTAGRTSRSGEGRGGRRRRRRQRGRRG